VSSYDYLTTVGLMPLGMAIAGPVSEAVGLHETLFAMSVAGWLIAAALLAVRSIRDLGRGPATAPEAWQGRGVRPLPEPNPAEKGV
jgi:hypothetical protein